MADKVSLSPNLISCCVRQLRRVTVGADEKKSIKCTETDTVSFSLTIGTTPMDRSSENVFLALR
jgi:hypothetical protein